MGAKKIIKTSVCNLQNRDYAQMPNQDKASPKGSHNTKGGWEKLVTQMKMSFVNPLSLFYLWL